MFYILFCLKSLTKPFEHFLTILWFANVKHSQSPLYTITHISVAINPGKLRSKGPFTYSIGDRCAVHMMRWLRQRFQNLYRTRSKPIDYQRMDNVHLWIKVRQCQNGRLGAHCIPKTWIWTLPFMFMQIIVG